jgi:hypothetical protein
MGVMAKKDSGRSHPFDNNRPDEFFCRRLRELPGKGKEKKKVHSKKIHQTEPFFHGNHKGNRNSSKDLSGMTIKCNQYGRVLSRKFSKFLNHSLVATVNSIKNAPGNPRLMET